MSNNTLGQRIKFHRTRLHMTQEQLAQKIGVSPQAVSKWEHDQSCPDILVLPDLAELFGLTVDELLGKEKPCVAEVVEEKRENHVVWSSSGRKGKILAALYVIVISGLILMNNLYHFDVSWWTVVWTVACVFFGLSNFGEDASLGRITAGFLGLYVLLTEYGVFQWTFKWSIAIPVMLLIWGLSLLIDGLRGKGKPFVTVSTTKNIEKDKEKREYSCDDGYIECEFAFGTHRTMVNADVLRGGSIETAFGQFTIDFSECKSASPDCTIEVEHGFGSLTLIFPKHLAVEVIKGDSAISKVNVEGSSAEVTNGTVRLSLENGFSNLNIRYID